MCRLRLPPIALGLLLVAAPPAWPLSGFDQVELAASGQFDQLARVMESDANAGKLGTADLHTLCYAYSRTKRYQRLSACLDRLEARLRTGDTATRLFALEDATPMVHLMRAEAAVELAQYDQAIAEARKSLQWMQDEDESEPLIELGARTVLALAHAFRGEPEPARSQLKPLSKTGKGYFTDEYRTARALALARVHMALGEYAQAYDALASDRLFKAEAFIDNLFSGAYLRGRDNWLWQDLPRAYMINRALLGMDRVETARDGYDRLIANPASAQNGEIIWLAHFDRGRIAERLDDPAGAIDHYIAAIEVIEAQRASINTEANKIGFVGDKQTVYARLINLLTSASRVPEALEYAERSKARALVDLLAGKQDYAAAPGQQDEIRRLLDQQREEEAAARVQDAGPAIARRSAALARLREVAPDVASLVSVATLPASAIQARLKPDEVLLEYYHDGTGLIGFAATTDTLSARRIDDTGLAEDIRRFRARIEDIDPAFDADAHALYRRLIEPFAAWLDKPRLTIVPHGAMHYLPFPALRGETGYLAQRHVLRLLPSASVLPFIKHGSGAGALVFGNPDLGSPRLDLPSAEVEARRIARDLPGSLLKTRTEASESALRQLATDFRYVHLATHGDFSAETPLRSALMLARDAAHDGILTVDEIYGLRLNADLVTLSACETGLGKVASGDDVVGLTRGFLYAGAASVLASLWKVDDRATADLMTGFYRELASGQDKAMALNTARLAILRDRPHPYYWAAFALTGADR